jgi:threonine dehydratase
MSSREDATRGGTPDAGGGRARPTIADVEAAAARIARSIAATPLLHSPWLSSVSGAEVWLKLESVQRTGSFKIRGAANALLRLRELRPDVRTVVTASAGNHGLAMATAAADAGFDVRVHLPETAPAAKRDALRQLGATLIEAPTYDAAETSAQEDVARSGAVFVSAYSHGDVIAGAGTIALEMIAVRPGLDVLIAPIGGGGLLSGAAIVARALLPDARVFGAEAAASPVFTAALRAGRPVTVEVGPTVADGLAGNMEPDSQTFAIVRDLVDSVVAVPEPEIRAAMRELAVRERLIVEGAAATAIAALAGGYLPVAGRRAGLIVSGRNVDVGDGPVFHSFPQAGDRLPAAD